MKLWFLIFVFFFFNDTATTEIYTLSLHDALPIYPSNSAWSIRARFSATSSSVYCGEAPSCMRSEEHTSELQSLRHLVCRLLLEKKTNNVRPAPKVDRPASKKMKPPELALDRQASE